MSQIALNQKQIDLILSRTILKYLTISKYPEPLKESPVNKIDFKAFPKLINLIKDQLTEDLKEILFSIVLLSKTTNSINLASSNAITLLNKSGFSFRNKDLSKIKIPYADLSYGLFTNTNFESSDLYGVNFSMSNIYSANFRNCNMIEAEFGEKILMTGLKAGQIKLSLCGRFFAITQERRIFLYDVTTYQKMGQFIGHTSYIFYLSFSHNGHYLVSLSSDRMILWDTASKLKIDQFMCEVFSSNFSACNNYLCMVCNNPESYCSIIRVYDINSRKIVNEIELKCQYTLYASCVAFFTPSGENLLIFDRYFLSLWNLNTKAMINQGQPHRYDKYLDTISPNHKYIAIPCGENDIFVYCTETLEIIMKLRKAYKDKVSLAFSPCGRYIAAISNKTSIEVFDLLLKYKVFVISRIRCFQYQSIAFTPNGKYLIIFNCKILEAQQIHYTKAKNKKIARKGIEMVAFSQNNEYYAVACLNGWIFVFFKENQKLFKKFQAHSNKISCISYSGNILASLDLFSIKIWNTADGLMLKSIKMNAEFDGIEFSPDGKKLLSYSRSKDFLTIWDTESSQMISRWLAHWRGIASSKWSHCGNFLITCGIYGMLKIWSTDNYNLLAEYATNNRSYFYSFTISDILICFGEKYDLKILYLKDMVNSTQEAKNAIVLKWKKSIRSITLSPDKKTLAAGDASGKIIIWDYIRGKSCIIAAHKGIVNSIDFSTDSNFIISSSTDKTIKLWQYGEF